MGEVNFYLKKPESRGRSLIKLQYKYRGKVLIHPFGENLDPKNRNESKQRVKK